MLPIERISPPSRDEFEARYVKRSRPVILRGAIDDWPAMKSWSLPYFKGRFGERLVPAIRRKDGSLYDAKAGLHYEKVRFADYVDRLGEARPMDLYMVFRVHEALPELFDDVIKPDYCRDARWYRARFWFGGAETKSPLHRDLPDNLYAQISGRKRFILLDRRLTRMVHQHPFYSGVPNYSPVDAEAPDLDRHPRFRGAPLLVADLEPGDLLYIPSLWWHQARAHTTSISVNLWWVDGGPMLAVVKAAELFMRLRDLKL
jgi:hypothetical protein